MHYARGVTRPRTESVTLSALRERLTQIEHRAASAALVPTGWAHVDRAFRGGLPRGAVHEWIGLACDRASRRWSPPLSVLLHLANQTASIAERESASLMICWIGAQVWPSAAALLSSRHGLLARSIFVEAKDAPSRVWAADLAARTPSVLTIVDGSGFDMAASRRLQLAAEAGATVAGGGGGRPEDGWLVHLTRPAVGSQRTHRRVNAVERGPQRVDGRRAALRGAMPACQGTSIGERARDHMGAGEVRP